jgi:hypothetical protein
MNVGERLPDEIAQAMAQNNNLTYLPIVVVQEE